MFHRFIKHAQVQHQKFSTRTLQDKVEEFCAKLGIRFNLKEGEKKFEANFKAGGGGEDIEVEANVTTEEGPEKLETNIIIDIGPKVEVNLLVEGSTKDERAQMMRLLLKNIEEVGHWLNENPPPDYKQ